jgi:hypothetical protein
MSEGASNKNNAEKVQDLFVPTPSDIQRDLSALTEKLNQLRDSL